MVVVRANSVKSHFIPGVSSANGSVSKVWLGRLKNYFYQLFFASFGVLWNLNPVSCFIGTSSHTSFLTNKTYYCCAATTFTTGRTTATTTCLILLFYQHPQQTRPKRFTIFIENGRWFRSFRKR